MLDWEWWSGFVESFVPAFIVSFVVNYVFARILRNWAMARIDAEQEEEVERVDEIVPSATSSVTPQRDSP